MQAITPASNSHKFFKYFTWKIKKINFYCSDFCKLLKTISSLNLEVVDIKKILVPNLVIYIYLHCVRRLSWSATYVATLVGRWSKMTEKRRTWFIEISLPKVDVKAFHITRIRWKNSCGYQYDITSLGPLEIITDYSNTSCE